MSNVHVRQPHALTRDDAKAKLAGFTELLTKYRVSLTWKGYDAAISGIGVSGDVKVGDAAVDVNVSLGMLARAAGVNPTKLQESISKRLREAYGG